MSSNASISSRLNKLESRVGDPAAYRISQLTDEQLAAEIAALRALLRADFVGMGWEDTGVSNVEFDAIVDEVNRQRQAGIERPDFSTFDVPELTLRYKRANPDWAFGC